MAAAATKRRAKVRSVPEDLEAVTREAVGRAPGLKLSSLKKSLPVSHQAFAKEAQSALRALADRGDVVVFKSGKTEYAFPSEPFPTLDRELPGLVGDQSVDKAGLKALLAEHRPGYEVVLDAWLAPALSRGVLFEQPPPKGKKGKRFGTKPDLGRLHKALDQVRELLAELGGKGVERTFLEKLVAETLVLSRASSSAELAAAESPRSVSPSEGRTLFVSALNALSAEKPRQAMLSIRELRPRVPLGKEQFDSLALDLMREGTISLHHHDHAASLPEAERLQFVQGPRGTYFNGIAPRRGE